jgi:hypothetical protein
MAARTARFISTLVRRTKQNAPMQRLAFVVLAGTFGLGAGFLLGWTVVGFALVQAGRGGHADLGIVFLSAVVGALLCSAAASAAVSRWLRRRALRVSLMKAFSDFHPELRRILELELAAGNSVVETWSGFGNGVLLAEPFKRKHSFSSATLEYREVDDPHYWRAEYRVRGLDEFVACRF